MIPMEAILKKVTPEHDKLVVCVAMYSSSLYIGWNSTKTSPAFHRTYSNGDESYSRHAELHAISQLPRDFNPKKVRLYVARLSKTGRMAMALPCPSCQRTLASTGIKKIYFTDWEGNWKRL